MDILAPPFFVGDALSASRCVAFCCFFSSVENVWVGGTQWKEFPLYLANIFFRREGSPCRSCSIRPPKVVRPEVKLQAELKTQERNKLIEMIGGGVVQEKERKAEECLNTLTLIDSDRVVRYHGLRSG
mmetsp:Transcript_37523/g.45297  ORF Transcript_37523/g.45297 Transcript_37523/m.45297 type:complete len:128 (-) Transcript_37523:89-472(-)